VILLDDRVAEGGLDAPHTEHERALHAEILLDAGEKRRELFRLFLPRGDLPFRTGAVEILPKLLVKFRLVAQRREPGRVGLQSLHDARVRLYGDAARDGLRFECRDPLLE
jgi:hypothetical protein